MQQNFGYAIESWYYYMFKGEIYTYYIVDIKQAPIIWCFLNRFNNDAWKESSSLFKKKKK